MLPETAAVSRGTSRATTVQRRNHFGGYLELAAYSLHIRVAFITTRAQHRVCSEAENSATKLPLWSALRSSRDKELKKCSYKMVIQQEQNGGGGGAGMAQWLEHRTRDWKVAGSNPCWNGGRIFFSGVDFLCWLLFRYPFHPRVTAVARKTSRSFCQKCRWQVTAKYAYTLRMWILLNRASALVTTCPYMSNDIWGH